MLVEIILMVLGIVILIASIGLHDNGNGKNSDSFFTENSIKEYETKIDTMVQDKLEKISEEKIIDADDTLSKLSNEKIMAVNEFAETNLAKIQENHDHVVFLYNMLTSKDDEIKQTLASMEKAKQDIKDTMSDVIKVTRQLNSAVRKNAKSIENVEKTTAAAPEQTSDKPKVRAVPVKVPKENDGFSKSSQEIVDESLGQLNLPEMMQSDNKNEEILKLYREGRSVLEISKKLSLGQGEVKLVIDLYGNN